ncbi:MAG: hypothetical protein HQ470_02440, partial [Methylophilales bacterium]|nr:hypothetical protein [Methylophilales bacterium]
IALPDASFIVMLALGFLLNNIRWFIFALLLSVGIDLYMIPTTINEPYNLNLGYIGLTLAYAIAWFIGKNFANTPISNSSAIKYSGLYLSATYLISTLSFYYFSGWNVGSQSVLSFLGSHINDFMISNISYLIIFIIGIKVYRSMARNSAALTIKSI